MKKVRSAFSLIEVVFVLVILGIVASISSSIIAQVYENYITQEALYSVTTKTEVAATQIVNRLTYRIQGTTIAKDPDKSGATEGVDWIMLKDIPKLDNNFTTVEWIGYDNDSLAATQTPGWSGVANYMTALWGSTLPSASRNSIYTPASLLTNTASIMTNLSNGKVTMADENHTAALIFQQKDNEYRKNQEYSPICMGLIDNNTSCIFRVTLNALNDDDNLSFFDAKAKIVTERYKLAWSAYALVPEDLDGDGLYDLYLYYNYQPWNGERYTQGRKSLLTNNVSVFKFTENGGVIQFKICASKNIGQANRISTCKEKVLIQ